MSRCRIRLPQVSRQALVYTSRQWAGLSILVMLVTWAAQAQAVPSGATETRGASQLLAYAPAASYLPSQVLNTPPAPGDESIRARLKSCLLLGDMACVVDQYLLLKDIGRMPGWLVAFQNAFAEANRRGESVSGWPEPSTRA